MFVFLVCFLVHFVSVDMARVLVLVPLRSVPHADGTANCRRM